MVSVNVYMCVVVTVVLCRHLSSAPFDKDLLCSCYGVVVEGRSQVQCGLWRIQEEEGPIHFLTTLNHDGGSGGNFRWSVLYLQSVNGSCGLNRGGEGSDLILVSSEATGFTMDVLNRRDGLHQECPLTGFTVCTLLFL